MTPRPPIFISAVSKELRSARQLVANTLQFLGYQPLWQDIFGMEQGDLRAMLRLQVDQCQGVVQLVGQAYGAEPPIPDEEFGRVSYTQYEALYARKRGKKVWYLFIDGTFPIDPHEPESAEARELQEAYRRRLQADSHLYHPLTTAEGLEAGVLKLRDDLSRLRRGVKQWAIGVAALLVIIAGLAIWIVHAQRGQSGLIEKQGEQVTVLVDRYQKMQQALVRLADAETKAKQPGTKLSAEEQRANAYGLLEKELGLPAGSLAKELPALALELYGRADTSALLRARAAYALGKFDEAQKLSLTGAAEDAKAYENAQKVVQDRRKSAVEGYKLAGQSAEKLAQYNEAILHFREAEKLTDRTREPQEWADVQNSIADVLFDQGQYQAAEVTLRAIEQTLVPLLGPEAPAVLRVRSSLTYARWKQGKVAEAETSFREIVKAQEKSLGPEHPDTLSSRNGLAGVFNEEGKFSEAEAEHRVILRAREKTLGAEDRETLKSRSNLAIALANQGKYLEAEPLFREVVAVSEKVLGPEHPDTLRAGIGVASILNAEGKYAEAEATYIRTIGLLEKVLGPEHPENLSYRNLLTNVLDNEGKFAEAEAQCRDIAKTEEKVLGPEHVETLRTRDNLAIALNKQHKHAEAETEAREVVRLEAKTLGPESVDTLTSRQELAVALYGRSKYSEAEAEFRELIKLEEKVLGPENPYTLDACFDFAAGLRTEGKLEEARAMAQRAAEGARKVMGPDNPETKKYEKFRQELDPSQVR
jgi:tetratricopeptide (TPR) repeat protein